MNPNSTPPLPEWAFLRDLGLTYKVGLVVASIGVLMILTSGVLGAVFYELVSSVLELLGAPEDREYLSPGKPSAGPDLLRFLGWATVACAACIASVRLSLGLLGLTPKPEPTDKLGPVDRAGLGLSALGVLVIASATIPAALLYDILPRIPRSSDSFPAFSIVASIGSLCLLCGLLVIAFGGPRRREVLLGWSDKLGWGKLGHGWVNKFAVALLLLAIVVSTVGPEDAGTFVFGAGIAVFLLGIAVNYFAGTNP